MKKLITFIIVAGLALTIQAQDITNTLAENGKFIIIDSQRDNLFTADENANEVLIYGWVTIGEEDFPLSTLDVRGSISLNLTSSSSSTLGSLSCSFFLTEEDGTVTLPDATNAYGRFYIIKYIASSGAGNVHTTNSQTIDGVATYVLTAQYKYVQVQSDGYNWFIIGQN